MNIDETLIKNKIREFIVLLKENKYITDKNVLAQLYNNLNNLKIIFDDSLKGDALVSKEEIKVNTKLLNKYYDMYGECYIDETLFHEFSHVANSIHKSLYQDSNSKIVDLFVKNTHQPFKKVLSPETKRFLYNLYITFVEEKKEPLLYNQIPNFGLVLLDEVIAQYLAQDLVKNKSFKNDNDYVKSNYLETYQERYFCIDDEFCYPEIETETAFACYEEFYAVAKQFLEKYNLTIEQLAYKSLNEDVLTNIMSKLNPKQSIELYNDLAILGIIFNRYYLLCDRILVINENDPSFSKKKVHEAIVRTLKK